MTKLIFYLFCEVYNGMYLLLKFLKNKFLWNLVGEFCFTCIFNVHSIFNVVKI